MANPIESIKGLPTWGKAAVGIGGLVVVYVLYKQHQNANAASSTTSSSQIDPATGYAYGSPEDQAALAAQSGNGNTSFGNSGAYGGYGVTNAGYGYGYGSNAQWAQAAEQGLSQIGYDPQQVATALGLYLASEPISSTQAQLIYAAIAEFGYPPVGSPQIILVSNTTPTGTGNGSGSGSGSGGGTKPPVTQPKSSGKPGMPSGLHATNVTTNSFVEHWTGVPKASMYKVRVTYQGALVKEVQVGPVSSAEITGLSPNHTYTVHVSAGNSSGWSSETNGPAVHTIK